MPKASASGIGPCRRIDQTSGTPEWPWVKNRVTPKWVALVSGNMDQSLRVVVGLILTHTRIDQNLSLDHEICECQLDPAATLI